MIGRPGSWRRIAAVALGIATILAIGALLFAWSGLYSVAASRGHWAIVEYALAFVMRNSVERRAMLIDPPPLDDEDLVVLGAGAYHSGCAWCHGAPGVPTNPVTRSMLPPPPDLSAGMRDWDDAELFWIVKHGIKYTGMPAWASQHRDDEVWSVVAFLRQLEGVDEETYRRLALGFAETDQSGREIATEEGAVEAAVACIRCHGAEDRGPRSALVPVLHGQPVEFLVEALRAYAAGTRESGIMQPLANDLSPEDIERVARYYSSLPSPETDGREADRESLERGRIIAEAGMPEAEVPPCLTCHSEEALPTYPRLAGQNARYIANQLRLWKAETTRHTQAAAVMTSIARALTDDQIDDVATYFESVRPAQAVGSQ